MRYKRHALFVMRPLLIYILLGIFLMIFGLLLAVSFADDPNGGWIGALICFLLFAPPGVLFIIYGAVWRIFVLGDRLVVRGLFGIHRTIYLTEIAVALTPGNDEMRLYRNKKRILVLGLRQYNTMLTNTKRLFNHLSQLRVPMGLENLEKTGIVRDTRDLHSQPYFDWSFAGDGSAVRGDEFVIRPSKAWVILSVFFAVITAGAVWILATDSITDRREYTLMILGVGVCVFCAIYTLLIAFRLKTVVRRDRFTVVPAFKASRTYLFSEISNMQSSNSRDGSYICIFVRGKQVLQLTANARGCGEFVQLIEDSMRENRE